MYLEIWLDDAPFCFNRAQLQNEHGTCREMSGVIETDSYGAEYLAIPLASPFSNECLFSWYFKFGILEPKLWDDRVQRIILHNHSSRDIYVWRYTYIASGETREICYHDTKHNELLGIYRPLGLGRFHLTTQNDDSFRAMLDNHGLILYRRVSQTDSIMRVRFIMDVFVRDDPSTSESLPEDYGFETSKGELSLDTHGNVMLTTTHSKYLFEVDPKDPR